MQLNNHAFSPYLRHIYESSLLGQAWEGVLRGGLLPGYSMVYNENKKPQVIGRT